MVKSGTFLRAILLSPAVLAAMFLLSRPVKSEGGGEATFKAKCAACHGADAAGKAAMKSPSIKGKTAEEIQKVISTSPKHAGLKSLTADQVKELAAYLGTLK
jgi:mono/diheme cytochrome c family protein